MGNQKIPSSEEVLRAAKEGLILDWSDNLSYGKPDNVVPINKAREKRDAKRK